MVPLHLQSIDARARQITDHWKRHSRVLLHIAMHNATDLIKMFNTIILLTEQNLPRNI